MTRKDMIAEILAYYADPKKAPITHSLWVYYLTNAPLSHLQSEIKVIHELKKADA